MAVKVSAAVVNYRGIDMFCKTIESILSHTKGVELTLYLIDNASGDGSAEKMRERFPNLHVIALSENLGYGGGNNSVLPYLESDYHAVINPDIEFTSDLLTEMAGYMEEHPDVGTVTPLILNPDGTVQDLPKRDPFLLALVGRRIFIDQLKRYTDRYTMKGEDLSRPTDIEFATGCLFMMRTEIFKKIGGFDDKTFFMHFEDADISRRARAEARLLYLPQFSAIHHWERDISHISGGMKSMLRSMFKYFRKWGIKVF